MRDIIHVTVIIIIHATWGHYCKSYDCSNFSNLTGQKRAMSQQKHVKLGNVTGACLPVISSPELIKTLRLGTRPWNTGHQIGD